VVRGCLIDLIYGEYTPSQGCVVLPGSCTNSDTKGPRPSVVADYRDVTTPAAKQNSVLTQAMARYPLTTSKRLIVV
jgi:hypothetical protein